MRSLVAGLLCTAVWGMLHGVAWAEEGTLLKAEELRQKPFKDARVLASVARGARVDIVKKEGAWVQVDSGGQRGWVRLLSVRRGEASRTGTRAEASSLSRMATGRAGTGKVVATTGIRGLSEGDLQQARFSEDEVKRLETLGVSRADAQKFARQGRLEARSIAYLPAPEDK